MVRALGTAIAVTLLAAGVVLATGLPATAARSPLPVIAAPPLRPSDPALTNQALRGRPAVLVFWASWCEPCQTEIPALAGAKFGVEVITVDTNDQRSNAVAFLRDHGAVALPSAFDADGSVVESLRLYGLPAAVFVDGDGNIVARHLGPISSDDIVQFAARRGRSL